MTEQSEAIATTTLSSTVPRSSLLDGVRQLAYAWVGLWGVTGFGWILVGFCLLLDIMTYASGGRNRNRIPGYPQSSSQM